MVWISLWFEAVDTWRRGGHGPELLEELLTNGVQSVTRTSATVAASSGSDRTRGHGEDFRRSDGAIKRYLPEAREDKFRNWFSVTVRWLALPRLRTMTKCLPSGATS